MLDLDNGYRSFCFSLGFRFSTHGLEVYQLYDFEGFECFQPPIKTQRGFGTEGAVPAANQAVGKIGFRFFVIFERQLTEADSGAPRAE